MKERAGRTDEEGVCTRDLRPLLPTQARDLRGGQLS
jgi:hypothetical protein